MTAAAAGAILVEGEEGFACIFFFYYNEFLNVLLVFFPYHSICITFVKDTAGI